MLMTEDDTRRVVKRCAWNESDAEWSILQFMYKHKKVQFPTIKNAESVVKNFKESQELYISDVENPKPRSKWATDGNNFHSPSPRAESQQNKYTGLDQFMQTKFSF